jgi:uncharacterized membrane protein
MRSKASYQGHPIHPALIPFPFAFLYGAFLFDVAARLAERPSWWPTGAYLSLVGIVAALIAAVSGFIDYINTVPPKSSGKRRATRHMLANLTAVVLFAAAWIVREHPETMPGVTVLTLEGIAVVLLTVAGWYGWCAGQPQSDQRGSSLRASRQVEGREDRAQTRPARRRCRNGRAEGGSDEASPNQWLQARAR